MFKRSGKKIAKSIGVGLIFFYLFWVFSAYSRGEFFANLDIEQEDYQLKVFGIPQPWREDYLDFLNQKYNVQYDIVGHCNTSMSAMSYADGYNTVTESYLNDLYGKDIFKECMTEARCKFQAEREEWQTGWPEIECPEDVVSADDSPTPEEG